MPFTISPGVVTKEIDLTTVVPEISMTHGAIAGPFKWGPALDRTVVSNESEMVDRFGKPNAATYRTWFTAASYLAYSGNLKVVRTPNTTDAKNIAAGLKNLRMGDLLDIPLEDKIERKIINDEKGRRSRK